MKAAALAIASLLGGCVVYSRPPYGASPSSPEPGYAPAPVAAAGISREQAVDVAFRIARDRGLSVDRVQQATLDQTGRWHVDVRGNGDRARLLLDARDGRLLRGRFKARGGERHGERRGEHEDEHDGEQWDD
ncbi:MAG TPA: hypothetical protein VLT61_10660 [Anaeromyxobacteraceae bacterium]|nr:hypothetical protein [Anaeromyxobacteraceae bacterium]